MTEPLKNIYSKQFFEEFTSTLSQVKTDFETQKFCNIIFDDEWETKELKQRMRHVTLTLHNFLPPDYKKAIDIILNLVNKLESNITHLSFGYMFLPDYVELYGLEDYETSMMAMERITQFASCEFAVRPFLIKYPEKMMKQMLKWSTHKHHTVRRFASEGCRPLLPWAMVLPELKNDPAPILPILENLKDDDSLFVRKSVANNLNDISKNHPERVIKIATRWQNKSKNTDWIIKHACRTLLKQGKPEAMKLFGYGIDKNLKIQNLSIENNKVKIGDDLVFSFSFQNLNKTAKKVRLEYAIYLQKANGTLSKKIFMIGEKEYPGGSTSAIQKKQSFKLITTRKYHVGLHQLSIIVNGTEQKPIIDFHLAK